MTTHEQLTQASDVELIEHTGGPVSVMRHEHDQHSFALEELERLTNGLTLPNDACGSWQRLYNGLSTFRDDLNAHIQTENELLFSRIDGGN